MADVPYVDIESRKRTRKREIGAIVSIAYTVVLRPLSHGLITALLVDHGRMPASDWIERLLRDGDTFRDITRMTIREALDALALLGLPDVQLHDPSGKYKLNLFARFVVFLTFMADQTRWRRIRHGPPHRLHTELRMC